jgi:hypothetical protein
MKIQISLVVLFSLLLFACGQPTEEPATDTPEEVQEEANKYSVEPFPGAVEFPDAAIEGFTFNENTFNFSLADGEYQLGVQTPDANQRMCANSGKGQHIHLIIDNQPYAAKYEAEFEYPMEDGTYHMLAFLSRSYHESIKTEAAHVARMITVEGGAMTADAPIEGPMLFYSRPKGTYVGEADTKKILLDFYPVNVELGASYKVLVDINGEETMLLDSWQPYQVQGLPMGENTITLTLVDGEGNAVDAPHNPVSRTFTLQADPAEQ